MAGVLSKMLIKTETGNYGTAEASLAGESLFPFESESLVLLKQNEKTTVLQGSAAVHDVTDIKEVVEGAINFEGRTWSLTRLIALVLGKIYEQNSQYIFPDNCLNDRSTLPWEGSSDTYRRRITVDKQQGSASVLSKVASAMVKQLQIDISPEGIKATADIIAYDEARSAASISQTTLDSDDLILPWQLVDFDLFEKAEHSSGLYAEQTAADFVGAASLQLTINNQLEDGLQTEDTGLNILQPELTAFRDITLTMNVPRYNNNDFFDSFDANIGYYGSLKMEDSAGEYVTIIMPELRVESFNSPVAGSDVIKQDIVFKAISPKFPCAVDTGQFNTALSSIDADFDGSTEVIFLKVVNGILIIGQLEAGGNYIYKGINQSGSVVLDFDTGSSYYALEIEYYNGSYYALNSNNQLIRLGNGAANTTIYSYAESDDLLPFMAVLNNVLYYSSDTLGKVRSYDGTTNAEVDDNAQAISCLFTFKGVLWATLANGHIWNVLDDLDTNLSINNIVNYSIFRNSVLLMEDTGGYLRKMTVSGVTPSISASLNILAGVNDDKDITVDENSGMIFFANEVADIQMLSATGTRQYISTSGAAGDHHQLAVFDGLLFYVVDSENVAAYHIEKEIWTYTTLSKSNYGIVAN